MHFIAFNAFKNLQGNTLKWQIGNSDIAMFFSVQRSTDGKSFESINTLNATNETAQTYSFTDQLPLINYYYRIEATDREGNKTYSTTLFLFNNHKDSDFSLYPNPAHTRFIVNRDKKGNATIFIADIIGKVIKTISNAPAKTVINIEGLKPGIYIITLLTDEWNSTERLVVN